MTDPFAYTVNNVHLCLKCRSFCTLKDAAWAHDFNIFSKIILHDSHHEHQLTFIRQPITASSKQWINAIKVTMRACTGFAFEAGKQLVSYTWSGQEGKKEGQMESFCCFHSYMLALLQQEMCGYRRRASNDAAAVWRNSPLIYTREDFGLQQSPNHHFAITKDDTYHDAHIHLNIYCHLRPLDWTTF